MLPERHKLIIVEDENIIAMNLRRQLESLGFEILDSCRTGEDAVAKVEQLRPDLVLMDIRLAGAMDGIEAAEVLRARFETPVIFLTAYSDDQSLERAKAVEPYGYILKPIATEELRVVTEVALHRHRAQQLLKVRARQQDALVTISRLALSTPALHGLFSSTVAVILQTLETPLCGVFELAEGGMLTCQAGIGWRLPHGGVPQAQLRWQPDLPMHAHEPAVLLDLDGECAAGCGAVLRRHGVVSGLGATIQDLGRSYGMILACATVRRAFTKADAAFLQSIANILSQTRQREQIDDARRRLAAIVESSDDAIVGKSLDGTITSWNLGAEHTYGYRAEDVLGRPSSILCHPDRTDEMPTILERIRRGERVDHYETERLRADGRSIHVSVSVSPVADADGSIIGASAISRDITDSRLVQQLRRQKQALERSNHDLEQYAHIASHDLQEPLRMVTMNLDLLRRRLAIADPFLAERLESAIAGGCRMRERISGVLAFSSIDAIAMGDDPVIDAGEVVREVLENLSERIRETDAAVNVGPLPRLRAHKPLLIQLFQNLIENALKYHGKIRRPEVEVSAERHGHTLIFSVHDNGVGVDPACGEQIFHIFQRLHRNADIPGTGVGLAICRKIVERHGGRIWVEPDTVGSYFRFSMPGLSPEPAGEDG